ncbi:MAG: hypothetical protein ABH896_04690 [Candidatus Jacksonbacteria bacterium]
MAKTKLKIYLDSTIPNYVFNDEYPEKQKSAKLLFNSIGQKRVLAFISPVTVYEVKGSDEPKQANMLKLLEACTFFQETPGAEKLAIDYIKQQRVFTKTNREDARHVAYAVYYGVDIIVSYNFSHIVRLSTIKKLQAANLILGYQTPEIRSPEEIDI